MVDRTWAQSVRRVALVLLVLGGVVGAGASGAAAQSAPGPTLAVTPASDLLGGHPVRAAATGLVPGQDYVLLDCSAAGCVDARAYSMTISTLATPLTKHYDPTRRFVTAATDGTIATSLRMFRTIAVGPWDWDGDGDPPPPTDVDCAATPCWVGIAPYDEAVEGAVVATAPVAFAATGTYQWTAGTASSSIPPDLRDQDTVTVAGAGWDPGSFHQPFGGRDKVYGVQVQICATGPGAPAQPCLPQGHVPVDHDGTVEGEVTVRRTLVFGGGATWDCATQPCAIRIGQGIDPFGQGGRFSATAPIDFGPEWAPFASAAEMVDRLAIAVTGGVLPAAERTVPVAALAEGKATAADALRRLVERPGAVGDVTTLYAGILQRRPDHAGLEFWVGRHRTGTTTAARLGEQFAGTPEVRAWWGSLSDGGIVDQTYQRVLGRASDRAGRAYWVGRLGAGYPRTKLIAAIALSPEARSRQRYRAAWTALALGIDDRAPTATEWDAAATWPEVADARLREAIASPEVRALAA